MRIGRLGQLELFARGERPPELTPGDRLKAVALLQSLLVEAISGAPGDSNPEEAGDDQDHV